MAMSRSLTLLDDQICKRHVWILEDVLFLKESIKFESHKREWKFVTFDFFDSINVVVTCLSFYNEEWEVTVGVMAKHGKEIAASKAVERREGNAFKVANLIKRSEIPSDSELFFFVEITRKEDGETQAKKAVFSQFLPLFWKETNHGHTPILISGSVRKLQSRCGEMLLTGKDSDVTIKVNGKDFYCHKCILAARAPVFSALFEKHMDDDSYIITKDFIQPAVFQEFLLYLYTGSGKHLSWDNFKQLYILGRMFDVEPLMDLCKVKSKALHR